KKDAFARETEAIREALEKVLGRKVTIDEAVQLSDEALKDAQSVVARDATPIMPVQAAEISRILAKRVFVPIDETATLGTAAESSRMYARNTALSMRDAAARPAFPERMAADYAFHPTLPEFLSKKLALVETFQGTRGVLRVLAHTVRNLWQAKQA